QLEDLQDSEQEYAARAEECKAQLDAQEDLRRNAEANLKQHMAREKELIDEIDSLLKAEEEQMRRIAATEAELGSQREALKQAEAGQSAAAQKRSQTVKEAKLAAEIQRLHDQEQEQRQCIEEAQAEVLRLADGGEHRIGKLEESRKAARDAHLGQPALEQDSC